MRSLPTIDVHKFGGAALADADAIRRVINIVARDDAQRVVVASAMLGVTDELLALAHSPGNVESYRIALNALRERHTSVARALGIDDEKLHADLGRSFDELSTLQAEFGSAGAATAATTDAFISYGDRLAARLLAAALSTTGVRAQFIDAVEIIRADGPHGNATPNIDRTTATATAALRPLLDQNIVPVVPGFVGQ